MINETPNLGASPAAKAISAVLAAAGLSAIFWPSIWMAWRPNTEKSKCSES